MLYGPLAHVGMVINLQLVLGMLDMMSYIIPQVVVIDHEVCLREDPGLSLRCQAALAAIWALASCH